MSLTAKSRRHPARFTVGCIAALGGLSYASSAAAQAHGWALDRFEPSPAGDTLFVADRPWYNGTDPFALRVGLIADYAHNSLMTRRPAAGGYTYRDAIVRDMLVMHAQVGISFLDRLNVHLSLPVSLWQTGTPAEGLSAMATLAAGDPRLGVRVRVFNHAERDAFSLHIGGDFYFNAGLFGLGPQANTTDNGFRGRLYVVGAGRLGPFAYSLGLGVHGRPTTVTNVGEVSSDLYINAGLALVGWEDRYSLGIELFASTLLAHAFEGPASNLEILAGPHLLLLDHVLIGLGVGPGFTSTIGTPDFRVVGQLAWAPQRRAPAVVAPPPVADSDHDGVIDTDDLCPSVPQGDHADPVRRGCPEDDRDRDGLLDSADQCPDEAQGDHPDPARAGCPEGDRDHDGVLDSADQCPEVARGDHPDPDRAGCPDGDDDHDGVLNAQDQCRTVPQGPVADPARPGCPIPDRDHDTVPDAVDHCPDQPGAPNPDPARNGCPGLVRVEGCHLNISTPVFFAPNRDAILPRSTPVMTAVSDALRASPDIRRVSVEGHTDDIGNDAANMVLSGRRAASVVLWLTQHGIVATRLESHGFGESHPVTPPGTLRGAPLNAARAANRRVEFRIVDGGANCTAAPASASPAP